MKIVIAGGTGHLGRILTDDFRSDGHHVVILSRNVEAPAVLWDGKTLGDWACVVDGADVVINLAGRSVNCRYDAKTRREILESRVDSTRVLGEAIALAAKPPRVWLQASTATIYAHSFDAPNNERTGVIGGEEPDVPPSWHFSIDVAKAWEAALDAAPTPRTRRVKMRMAVVMGTARGGIFDLMLRHVRMGFGRFGDGRQWMSWIHEHDFLRAIRFLIAEEIAGVVNVVAPCPLPNAAFVHELREAWGSRLAIPSAGRLLELGAWLVRTEPELVLKSRRVVPARLLEHGFVFEYPEWREAVRELVARRRGGNAPTW